MADKRVKVVITVTEPDGRVNEATYWNAETPIVSTVPAYRGRAPREGPFHDDVQVEHVDFTVTFRGHRDPDHSGDIALYTTKESECGTY